MNINAAFVHFVRDDIICFYYLKKHGTVPCPVSKYTKNYICVVSIFYHNKI